MYHCIQLGSHLTAPAAPALVVPDATAAEDDEEGPPALVGADEDPAASLFAPPLSPAPVPASAGAATAAAAAAESASWCLADR